MNPAPLKVLSGGIVPREVTGSYRLFCLLREWKSDVATETLFQQKAIIRKEILKKRKAQDPEARIAHSQTIVKALMARGEYQSARTILIYLSKDDEVGTDELLNRSFESGKRVLVPVVCQRTGELNLSELAGPDIEFQAGSFGVREPVEKDLNLVPPEQVDLVVIPGVAFDRRGGRIGYGKGYYDRLLNRLGSQVHRVALAFDFQVLGTVPQDDSDIRVETIITEKIIMNCSTV
jgi:5-formyltetrahydrofolate cyclo-ligase